jgi:hypothetical protein
MSGFTNKGKYRCLEVWLRGGTPPANLNLALDADAVTPTADTNIMSDLSEIPAGNGYSSGGLQVNRNSTDFDVLTEDDANDRALIQLKNFSWTASGGNLPASGNGARWAVLTDANATVGNREIYLYWSLGANRTVSNGQSLTLIDCEARLNET